jgi:signal transduction histidine kinase
VAMVFAGAAGQVAAQPVSDRQKQVLVLYATRRDAQIVAVGDRELPRMLESGLTEGLDYYSEFIDQARFPRHDYPDAFHDFLAVKYKDRRFDLVVAMGDVPLAFVDRNRDGFFKDVPVVFFTSRPPSRRLANATGVTAELNLADTLTLAMQLQPDTRHVFVINGIEVTNRAYEVAAREQLRPFESRVSITYLVGLPTRTLEARLASLPRHSIVYYLVVDRDGANESFHPLEYLDRIAAVANAPVYSWVDSAMDHGIVGGSLKDQVAQTRAVGELALRVLQGEKADSITRPTRDLNVRQVDWRELRRWGISDSRVPTGTVVRFREPSAWQRYKIYIVGALAIVLAQTVLIAGLLVQRTRRRQAESRARRSQAELRTSYERIHDLGGRLLHAQEAERARIARELHDDISQQMALLTIDLELLGRANSAAADNLAVEALTRARGVARSVHNLSHRLHPSKLRLIGLVAALQALQRELSHSAIPVRFTHANVPPVLPPDVTLCVFRTVQEALQNAMKYSHAHDVSVHLTGDVDRLVLTVVDDGVGFDVATAWGKGLGLVSMSERLEAIGGTIDIRSRHNAGTQLEIVVPLHHGANAAAAAG